MTAVSYTVVGDSRRKILATRLADRLEASLALDVDGRWGPGVNHARAWVLGNTEKCDWICVIEDDAILCTDFIRLSEKALANAPTPVVSFYLGSNYPTNLAPRAVEVQRHAEDNKQDWLQLNTLNHAVCVAIRESHVDDMLRYVTDRPKLDIDAAMSEWAQVRGIKVSYPTVSLVDHLDDEPVIDQHKRSDHQSRGKPRKALRFLG